MEGIYKEIDKCIDENDVTRLESILQNDNTIDLNNRSLYVINTPLCRAINNEQYEMCKMLISYGAKINHVEDYSDFPLKKACSNNRIDIVKLLIENGADLDMYQSVCYPALCTACRKGYYDIVEYLIECGADINRIVIDMGFTPLDIAIMWGQTHLFELLKGHGALTNIKRDYDWSQEEGGGISAHIDYNIGRVVAPKFNVKQNNVFNRIAFVNKDYNPMLYSVGNFRYGIHKTEFAMVLPHRWNPYSESEFSRLPYRILDYLSQCIQNGRIFSDGEFVPLNEVCDISDNILEKYAGFHIVDYNYTKADYKESADTVTIFTVIPQVRRKKENYMLDKTALEKIKTKKWGTLEWKFIPTLG